MLKGPMDDLITGLHLSCKALFVQFCPLPLIDIDKNALNDLFPVTVQKDLGRTDDPAGKPILPEQTVLKIRFISILAQCPNLF